MGRECCQTKGDPPHLLWATNVWPHEESAHSSETHGEIVQQFVHTGLRAFEPEGKRSDGEEVVSYVTELRRLAGHCEFEEHLEHMLRDFFVLGIGHETILRKLLTGETQTLSKAIAIAQAFVATSDNTKQISQYTSAATSTVNKVMLFSNRNVRKSHTYLQLHIHRCLSPPSRVMNARPLIPCRRCAGDHRFHLCRFKEYICKGCGTMGHLQRVCRRTAKPVKPENHHVAEEDRSTEDHDEPEPQIEEAEVHGVHTFTTNCPPIMLNVELNGLPVSMELDTGASQSIMGKKTFDGCGTTRPQGQS
uniref:uncharacterized protein n=1 Tax=Pristiophorus japonicus TaxID=55135 RepID=UPI00398ED3FC